MLWTASTQYLPEPFELEAHLEAAIQDVKSALFGNHHIYLDIKKKIGVKGRVNNIPDGYLLDLQSRKKPMLYVVENELGKHDALRHISVQLLEFSISFDDSPTKVKSIIKQALEQDTVARQQCIEYAESNGFENIDYLLERMIYDGGFNALVIIDELSDELETILNKKLGFPVEVLTLTRYKNQQGERIYEFEPFLQEVLEPNQTFGNTEPVESTVDFSDIDTVVVPAREDGFQEVAVGENRWHHIRLHGAMIPKIKYIAFYQVAPISAITHIAPIKSIKPWQNTNKYVLNFSEPVQAISPLPYVPNGKCKPPQSIRYTSRDKLFSAKNLDEAF